MTSTSLPMPSRITKDAFFYSCQQSFDARLKKDSFDSHLRYEPFLTQTYELPKAPSAKTFMRELDEVFKHHKQKTPQFKRNDKLTLDNSAWFTQAIATLLADVATLLRYYTNQSIPAIPFEPVEFSDARPVLNASIAKWVQYSANKTDETPAFVLFPIEEGLEEEDAVAANQQPAVFAAELWDLLVQNIENTFSAEHAQLILEFFDWSFKPTAKPEKPIDWRIRPPVGELFFQYQKSMGFIRSERGGRFDKKDGKRGGERDKDRDRRGSKEDRPKRDRSEREPRHQAASTEDGSAAAPAQREPRGDKQKRYTREDAAAHRRERPHREKAERVEFEDNKQALEHLRMKAVEQNCLPTFEAALAEVNDAAERFKNEPSLSNLPLSPQNPFLRRAQHSLAVELGFETESTGEGRERCVCLKRKS